MGVIATEDRLHERCVLSPGPNSLAPSRFLCIRRKSGLPIRPVASILSSTVIAQFISDPVLPVEPSHHAVRALLIQFIGSAAVLEVDAGKDALGRGRKTEPFGAHGAAPYLESVLQEHRHIARGERRTWY